MVDRLPNLITVFLGIVLEASPFLLFGVLVASVLEVAVPTERLSRFFPRGGALGLASGIALGAAAPLCECGTVPISILIMMLIAVVLSTCSSVDAFVALAFSTTFAPGAILAFLLISPVLNLKSGALVVGVFRPHMAVPLLGAATATILVAALAVNYHLL